MDLEKIDGLKDNWNYCREWTKTDRC